jgi:hypothetical protein
LPDTNGAALIIPWIFPTIFLNTACSAVGSFGCVCCIRPVEETGGGIIAAGNNKPASTKQVRNIFLFRIDVFLTYLNNHATGKTLWHLVINAQS